MDKPFKEGDHIRITKNVYTAHYSRRIGGTGVILCASVPNQEGIQTIQARLFNDPMMHQTWTFFSDEIEHLPKGAKV